jgi:hypothetical protein
MSEILLNDFNNIYPLEKDLPKNKLNEQDIVRTLAVCYHQAKKHEEAPTGLKTALLINQAYFCHLHSIDYQSKPHLASHNLED